MRKMRILRPFALLTTLGLVLSGCATNDTGSGPESDQGFAFGASQEEVDTAIEDLDPVTLTFQPVADSPNSLLAAPAIAFQEAVEERSGGRITLDTVWGQAIAPPEEVDDALLDGRIDIAYTFPIYDPEQYPVTDAYNRVSHYSKASTFVGEAISHAVMTEAGWNDPDSLAQYTDQDLTPLNPHVSSGAYWFACNSPGTTKEDMEGRQIRIGGSQQISITEAIGASPVSMEFGETFEGLQRGTVDCTLSQGQTVGASGIVEAAPYVSAFSEGRTTGSMTSAHVAGSSFEGLPLAYQQIIFDAATIDWFHGNLLGGIDGLAQAMTDVKNAGGEMSAVDPEVQETMSQAQEENVDTLIDQGALPDDIRDQLEATAEKWTAIIEDELGYEDSGDQFELDEWYEIGSADFRPLGERIYEEAAHEHRPE